MSTKVIKSLVYVHCVRITSCQQVSTYNRLGWAKHCLHWAIVNVGL